MPLHERIRSSPRLRLNAVVVAHVADGEISNSPGTELLHVLDLMSPKMNVFSLSRASENDDVNHDGCRYVTPLNVEVTQIDDPCVANLPSQTVQQIRRVETQQLLPDVRRDRLRAIHRVIA